jgi:hypothetical protein
MVFTAINMLFSTMITFLITNLDLFIARFIHYALLIVPAIIDIMNSTTNMTNNHLASV